MLTRSYPLLSTQDEKENKLDIVLCTVRLPAEEKDNLLSKKKYSFEVMNPSYKRPLLLRVETEVERLEWVKAIQDAISLSLNAQTLHMGEPRRGMTHALIFEINSSYSSCFWFL